MKNERYLAEAVARLRQDQHLPERALALSDDDLIGITQSVYNVAQELAVTKTEIMTLEFDDAELLKMMRIAHDRDITFNEFIVLALEAALAREESKNLDKEID